MTADTILSDTSFKASAKRFLGRAREGLSRLSESRIALVGLILFLTVVLTGILAPLLATHDPLEMDFLSLNASASWDHWMGTDNLGRDIWSRLVYGAQNAILVAIVTIPAQMGISILVGGLSGYYGGKIDNLMMRFNDAAMSFPGLILFLGLLAVLGSGLWQCILALSLGGAPRLIRVVRGLVISEREREYVKAGKMIGDSSARILFRQIIPNVSSPLIVMATIRTGGTLLAFAGLSFLGLGPPPPEPSWGLMLKEAQDLMETAPMVAVYPGLAISITVLGINLLGDGLRDILDPRLTEI